MCAYDKYIQQFHVLQQFDIIWKLEFYFYCETRMNSLLRITLYFISIGKIKSEDNIDILLLWYCCTKEIRFIALLRASLRANNAVQRVCLNVTSEIITFASCSKFFRHVYVCNKRVHFTHHFILQYSDTTWFGILFPLAKIRTGALVL